MKRLDAALVKQSRPATRAEIIEETERLCLIDACLETGLKSKIFPEEVFRQMLKTTSFEQLKAVYARLLDNSEFVH